MKKTPCLMIIAATLAFVAGCQSVGDRIEENPELFASLDRETQAKVREGMIDLGYTQDMVYLALGEPNRKRKTTTPDGVSETWIYNTHFQRYDGQRMVGYDRTIFYDKKNDTYRVFYTPRYTDTYVPETQERIRIVFQDNQAVSIEQGTD